MAKDKVKKSSTAPDKDGKPSGGLVHVLVRHGMAYFLDKDGNQRTVFRGQKVKMPASEAERLRAHGAVVDADAELPRVGRITPIPNTASDEELIAWVSVATKSEIVEAIAQNPALGDRILAARDTVKKRLEAQDELLSGIDSTVKQGSALAKKRAQADKSTAPTSGAGGKNATRVTQDADDDEEDEDDDDDDDDDLDEDDPRSVVKGNVGEVSAFLNDNPDKAQAILEAEQDLAQDEDREVRPGVVAAAQAAISNKTQ